MMSDELTETCPRASGKSTRSTRFREAFRYIEEHGYKVIGQHRTCYIDGAWNQKDPEKWLSVIQIPIE